MGIDFLKDVVLPVINTLTPLIYLVSAYFAYGALQTARRNIQESVLINRRSKRADTIIHCNNRYDELYKLRISIREMENEGRSSAVRAYYARFWGLKSDQFDYWLAGLVDIHTFCDWLSSTLRSFKDNKQLVDGLATTSFLYGWEEIGKVDNEIPNPWFSELIESLIELSKSDGMSKAVFDELLEIIAVVDNNSKPYREKIQREMSIEEYMQNRRQLPRLGLLKRDREKNDKLRKDY